MLQVFTWWLLIQLLGLAALPLAYRLFKWLPGRGYTFAKPLGLLLTSYFLWSGASLGILRNTRGGAIVALGATATLSIASNAWWKQEADYSLIRFLRDHWRLVLTVETLFAMSFLAWAAVRAYAPDRIMTSGGEKFMEIAFLNAILESPTFPPRDPWLSGFAISYYYFGYVMMALLTRLSGALPGVGFELYGALIFALTLIGAWGVVTDLVTAGSETKPDKGPGLRYGHLGSLFVGILGNLEGLLEACYARGVLPRAFWDWIDIPDLTSAGRVTGSWYPGHGWWWWRASRVIRDRNLLGEPMPLNPIDEFPFFSFLLGDNHPHVIALPFVLLAISLALNLLLGQRRTNETHKRGRTVWWNPAGYAMEGNWAMFGIHALALGSLGFLNTWDYPIYVGLLVLVYAAARHLAGDNLSDILWRAVVLGVGLVLVGVLLYLPFYVSFSSQAGGPVPYVLPPTRLPQYLVMFGPFVFVATSYLLARRLCLEEGAGAWRQVAQSWVAVVLAALAVLVTASALAVLAEPGGQAMRGLLSDPRIQEIVGEAGPGQVLKAIIGSRVRDPWLFLVLSLLIAGAIASILQPSKGRCAPPDASAAVQFCLLLLLCGLGLTLVVEFVYLRDSFGVRMNTIFKFYYQAWVMLACASAFGIWWVIDVLRRRMASAVQILFVGGTALLTAAGLVYPVMATYSRVAGFQHKPVLNGSASIARDHPDDWAAIEWLRAHAEEPVVILEAPGRSYTYEGRISAFTGYPTVLGWALHESQWRGDYVEQGRREPDIKTIYTTQDKKRALELLHKWQVSYVVVGPPERRYAEEVCAQSEQACRAAAGLDTLDQLLRPVFQQGRTTVYRVPDA